MRKSIKIKLVAILAFILTLLVLPACQVGEQPLDDRIKEFGSQATVTYYTNEGIFSGTDARVKVLHYHDKQYVLNITESNENADGTINRTLPKVEKSGKVLYGWYHVVTETVDGETVPVYTNDAKTGVLLDETKPVTFPVTINKGENWHIGAKWGDDVKLEYRLVADEGETLTGKDGTQYQNGDTLKLSDFDSFNKCYVSGDAPVEMDGYTFVYTYFDTEFTEEAVGQNVVKPTNEQNYVVYARYVKGDWTVVRTRSDASKMFINLGNASNKFYIMKDIDFTNGTVDTIANGIIGNTSATIEGNGFKIKNVKFNAPTNLGAGQGASIFGNITASASIKNVTFENVTVTARIKTGSANIFAICSSIEDGATLSNVKFDGLKLTISKGQGSVANIPDAANATNWLFGGSASDAAFVEKFPGITVIPGDNGGVEIN